MTRPKILLDPHPRPLASIFNAATRKRLDALGDFITHEGSRMPDAMVDAHIADVDLVIGQTRLHADRLVKAKKLRAIIDVETNFTDAIDYDYCFRNGIHVLTPGAAFADAVAESALGMAIDLARGITAADRKMRHGSESYGLDGNVDSFHLMGSAVGLVGYGDLARSLHRLIAPFNCPIKAYDPWVPDYLMQRNGVAPASLDEVLSTSKVIFVFAGVTAENQGFLGRREFGLIRPGSAFLLMSRAAVVDFPVFLEFVGKGRFRAATDVFPVEPVPQGDPVRSIEGLLLSAHRTGGMPEALFDIGRQTVADAELILKGLPPVVCRKAQRETVSRLRSKPIDKT
ncbi:MAG: hydroxyacid dehydrogenase [Proteobacteria bacterium]|nr:hydroxyacid dehydrogenase [Pseudomonadota bacterium]